MRYYGVLCNRIRVFGVCTLMSNGFTSLCDEFFIEMLINTELDLPTERDTVLAFCERIEKQFPSLNSFHRRENGDFVLEEDRQADKYRWVSIEADRLCAGCANPDDLEDAFGLQRLVLDLAPYMMGLSHLDVESLDMTFTMDFDFQGNHNEVISDALLRNTAFHRLLDMPGAQALGMSPATIISLSEDCRTQARIAIESRSNASEIRQGRFKSEEPISLYMTIRQYPPAEDKFDLKACFLRQCEWAETLMAERIIPDFVKPLASAIAQRR
jgi:hypothetical protein